MRFFDRLAGHNHQRIRIEKPQIKSTDDEHVWEEVVRFSKLVPLEPEPNMGRVQEVKDEIRKGAYLNSEKLEETAARLAIRFMRKE